MSEFLHKHKKQQLFYHFLIEISLEISDISSGKLPFSKVLGGNTYTNTSKKKYTYMPVVVASMNTINKICFEHKDSTLENLHGYIYGNILRHKEF